MWLLHALFLTAVAIFAALAFLAALGVGVVGLIALGVVVEIVQGAFGSLWAFIRGHL
jgi:hypothetical protein